MNLQVADTVINMDQPWNPARLEQRIARAWREHQTRTVPVIHLVSEDTIEHRMLGAARRQAGAGRGCARPTRRSCRHPHVQQPGSLHGTVADRAWEGAAEEATATESESSTGFLKRLRGAVVTEHGASLQRILACECTGAALVVLPFPPARLAEEERRLSDTGLTVRVIDPGAYEAMQRLAEAGLISMPVEGLRELYPFAETEDGGRTGRVLRTKTLAAGHEIQKR